MKKIWITIFIVNAAFVIAQEVYIPGCVYENNKPIPVYWVNNEIELLGKPIGSFGEAVDIINYSDNILVFGYLILEGTQRKIPVVWSDNNKFDILNYPEWEYSNCTVKKAFVFNNTVYVLGYMEDRNGHYSSIIWRDFSHFLNNIIKKHLYNIVIYDVEIIDNSIIAAGYIQDYNGISKRSYVYNITTGREIKEPYLQNLQEINIVKKINDDIFYCGRINNKYVIIKNDAILYIGEENQNGIVHDIAEINGTFYSLVYINDGNTNRLYYRENLLPYVEIGADNQIISAEIVGLGGKAPVIIFSEWIYESSNDRKQYGIIIDNTVINLKF